MNYDILSEINVKDSVEINNKLEEMIKKNKMTGTDDDLSLEYILNVLDGIVELNNIIVFFTTNVLETIDPALTRVGRIDKLINMDYLSSNMLEEILNYYYPEQT